MSDRERLEDKLQKLANADDVFDASGRVLPLDASDPARAILAEIDETMLARRLTFTNQKGVRVVMDVAGRRLLQLIEAEGISGDALAPIVESADPQLSGFSKAINDLLLEVESLNVQADPIPSRPDASTVGRSVEALEKILGETAPLTVEPTQQDSAPAERPPENAPLDQFLAAAADMDWSVYRGDVTRTGGHGVALSEDIRSNALANLESPCAVVLQGRSPDAGAVLLGDTGTEQVAVRGPATAFPTLIAAWQAAFE